MKNVFVSIFLLVGLFARAQSDTLIVHDYTKVMIGVSSSGAVVPITTLDQVRNAGFFINGAPEGKVRICNDHQTYVWIEGRLLGSINGCEVYDPEDFFEMANSDTVYVSLYSEEGLTNLTCQLVTFEELLVIKDDPKLPREVRNEFREFTITSILMLLFGIGLFMISNPSRMMYLLEKSFTLKISSYEFVNTNFISGTSMQLLGIFSLFISFFAIYYDQLLDLGFRVSASSYLEFIQAWLRMGLEIFAFVILKWIFITSISKLFRFRDLNNFQLFDFLNFSLFLIIPIFIFTSMDFVINQEQFTWIPAGFELVFPVILILFILWFSFKFVSNSPRRKLLIISYLCATEIIPAIMIFGWFYK